jgi:K+-transporting ATPase KdpF subunit
VAFGGLFRVASRPWRGQKQKLHTGVWIDDGHCLDRDRRFVLRAFVSLRERLRSSLARRIEKMLIDYVLGGGVTVFLLAYLTYALIRPERF